MIYFHPYENINIQLTNDTNRDTAPVLNRNIMMSIDQSSGPSHPQSLLPLPNPQSYRDVQAAGLPVNPLEFPTPVIHRAQLRSQQSVLDYHTHYAHQPQPQQTCMGTSKSGSVPSQVPQPFQHDDVNLLCHTSTSDHAYWMKNEIPSIGRNVHLGTVVVRRKRNASDGTNGGDWMTTNEMVFIKSTSMTSNTRTTSGSSGPLTEAACLQLIGNYHANILGCIEVLQSDDNIYTVMPYCPGSCSLESFLQHRQQAHPQWNTMRPPTHNYNTRGRNAPLRVDSINSNLEVMPSDYTVRTVSSDGTMFTSDDNTSTGTSTMFTVYEKDGSINNQRVISQYESSVRILFLQLLEALQHLQRKGVSHRNISTSSFLIVVADHANVSSFNNVVLTDFTSAVRVPYQDDSNVGGIADVSQGSNRLLIRNTDYRPRATRSPSNGASRSLVTPVGVSNDTTRTAQSQSPRARRYHSTTSPSSSTRHYQTSKKSTSSTIAAVHLPGRKTASTNRQRLPFIAPELLEGQPYDGYTVDLWSAGVLLYVMLLGTVPFHSPNITTDVQYRQINLGQLKLLIKQQQTVNGTQPHQYAISDEVLDLLQNMLWYDPRKRLTLQDVLMHPWIRSHHTLMRQQYKMKP